MTTLGGLISRRDGKAVAQVAHQLQGSLAVFGADDGYAHAQVLEACGAAEDFDGAVAVYTMLQGDVSRLQAVLKTLTPES